MTGFTIKHDDELERDYGKWVLVRRSLGLSAFGMNAVELPPGESIPEHDETERDHEEVFLVLEAHPRWSLTVRTIRCGRARSCASIPSRSARCETTPTLSPAS